MACNIRGIQQLPQGGYSVRLLVDNPNYTGDARVTHPGTWFDVQIPDMAGMSKAAVAAVIHKAAPPELHAQFCSVTACPYGASTLTPRPDLIGPI